MTPSPDSAADIAPPDRLSVDPRSTHFNQAALERGVGIVFNGVERSDVEEYCVSEGWIAVAAGRTLNRKGRPMLIKLKGQVAPYFKTEPDAGTAP